MVDYARTPGYPTPGPQQPGSKVPGSEVPDQSAIGDEEVSQTGVAVDGTGTTTLGDPQGRQGEVREVRVDATDANFQFNVNAGGEAIFSSNQSPTGTDEEVFIPTAELAEFAGDSPELVFEVISSSTAGGATADVTAVTAIEEQTG